MKFVVPPIRYDASPDELRQWLMLIVRDLEYILNGRVEVEDQLDAEESEVTFAATGVAGQVNVPHGLGRVPVRVEVVRADQAGVAYVVARTVDDVDIETDAVGTYRVRLS